MSRFCLIGGCLVLVAALAGCADDPVGTTTSALSPDTATAAVDTITLGDPDDPDFATLDNRSARPGIVFGTWNMESSSLNSVHTGWVQGGPLEPATILSKLSAARAKGGRVVVKLCKGHDRYVQNDDRTFSLSKWKQLVGRYRSVNLGPYIADGTILGHLLIDEPQLASRWGGKVISQATVEEMARYSKQLWPTMSTLVRVVPSWLGSASLTYNHLDAGWTQYTADKGDVTRWVNSEAEAARRKGLGLVVGMNVRNGGNGSSGIRGLTSGKWAMGASEIRKYGSALLAQSRACGFYNWNYDSNYYGRSDIRSAMTDVSAIARRHAKTSCRQ